jgi:hypothetical protein
VAQEAQLQEAVQTHQAQPETMEVAVTVEQVEQTTARVVEQVDRTLTIQEVTTEAVEQVVETVREGLEAQGLF